MTAKMLARMFVTGYILSIILFDSAYTSTNFTLLSRKRRQTQKCILPSHPPNGQWALLNGNGNPGDEVYLNSIVEFSCNARYKLDGNKHAVCIKGWNVQKMPTCKPICEPRFSTSTTILKCFDTRGEEINCVEATTGSYMQYDCSAFYEPTPGQRKIIYCNDGLWSEKIPKCRPICGRRNDAMALLYGGTIVSKLLYPWIVAIYQKENNDYTNICGGTIIHRKAVLTAAHCVTNEYSDLYPVEDFYIAAAKLYNKYNDSRDNVTQYMKVSELITHPQYKGDSKRLLADIALMITETPFKFNSLVRPVCINDLTEIFLQPGSTGEIAGWGRTESGLPSDELRAIEIPHKDEQICVRQLPSDWAEKYYIIDKICAGYPEKNVSVCKGDSGSGLAFKNIEDNRYYVHGIVSVSPTTKKQEFCNIFTNALYTKVSFYYEFIDVQLNRLDWCKLPNYPKNGKWVLQKSSFKVPGDLVSPYDIVEVLCDKGYNLTSSNLIFSCETLVYNEPSCLRNEEEKYDINSSTTLSYRDEDDCGKKIHGSSSEPVNGKVTRHLDYPWAALIYKLTVFYTHGTVLSKKLVVTAARYLSVNGIADDTYKYIINVGTYYRDYGDRPDESSKYYQVDKIIIYNQYNISGRYGDLAFAVVNGTIEYNQWIKPICLKGVNNILIPPESILEIVGWDGSFQTIEPLASKVALKTINNCLHFSQYFSPDVICGSYIGGSVGFHHNGAGLVYENPIDKRYYLAGIHKYFTNETNTLYVSVQYHYDHIIEQINKYR